MQIPGATNFRRIGTLRRLLFRSDHLGALDGDDARQIQALGITRVLDFRGVDERTTAACRLPGVTVHSLPIEPTIVQKLQTMAATGQRPTPREVDQLMRDTYRAFVRHNTHRFAEFFGYLLESDEPTVFHCTAGKDRTGLAPALLLQAVDTPADEVMHDYLLTNERLALPDDSRHGLPREVMEVLWRVQPEYLAAAYAEADDRFGSLDDYLSEGLGLGEAQRQRLKAMYQGG